MPLGDCQPSERHLCIDAHLGAPVKDVASKDPLYQRQQARAGAHSIQLTKQVRQHLHCCLVLALLVAPAVTVNLCAGAAAAPSAKCACYLEQLAAIESVSILSSLSCRAHALASALSRQK